MKVQQIKQSATYTGLEDRGTVGLPDTEPARISGRQVTIAGSEQIRTGVFECTPGTYRRSVKEAETMHFLFGRATFTPDGEAPIEMTAGDTLFFEAETYGLWVVHETIRKVYVVF